MRKHGRRFGRLAGWLVPLALSGAIVACDRVPTVVAEAPGGPALTTACEYAVGIDGPRLVDPGETVTWTAFHTGCSGTFTYRWLYSTNGTSWTTVGGTGSTYTRTIASAPFYRKVRLFSASTGTLLDESGPISIQY